MNDPICRIDRLIKESKGAEAKVLLERLLKRKIPRDAAVDAASLAWRVGLADAGIRILSPVVRGRGRVPANPTPREQAEYAVCLVKVGATDEALKLLDGIDIRETPRALLYRAFALFSQWDYEGSIPWLKQYVDIAGLTPYDRNIGRINLAAAFVYECRHRDAQYLLRDILYESSLRRWEFALGRALELSAENFVAQGKWDKVETFLAKAEQSLKGTEGLDLFFVKKLRAVSGILADPKNTKAVRSITEVRKEATSRRHWETVRDCDRFLAIANKDDELLIHLHYGTPYKSFRDKIVTLYSPGLRIPQRYDWRPHGGKGGPLVDLTSGRVEEAGDALKLGQALHRLLATLCSDFYRPLRTASLFGEIYPGEYFNPVSSPLRIRQLMKRLRQWIGGKELPLEVEEEGGAYRLTATAPCAIRLSTVAAKTSRKVSALDKLRDAWPGAPFSKIEAAQALGMSTRSTLRVLEEAIADGGLVREGRSNATRYRFLKAS